MAIWEQNFCWYWTFKLVQSPLIDLNEVICAIQDLFIWTTRRCSDFPARNLFIRQNDDIPCSTIFSPKKYRALFTFLEDRQFGTGNFFSLELFIYLFLSIFENNFRFFFYFFLFIYFLFLFLTTAQVILAPVELRSELVNFWETKGH